MKRRPFDGEPYKSRTKKIKTVPVTKTVLEAALKALVDLLEVQFDRKLVSGLSSRSSSELKDLIMRCGARLWYKRLQAGKDRGVGRNLRDSYTVKVFVATLGQLWQGPRKPTERCKLLRGYVALSTGHHLPLRDEDVRYFDISDCFGMATDNAMPTSKTVLAPPEYGSASPIL
ncbi:hypothetical protein BG015_002679 [Linnemannia schmuckeri]|uniref:Uncharacterized protein n=1 Tax=Linnemannia schmuckeri TaxID=64567 RepID=A0A9P5S5I7_9FUNG|nr:hypothetical protein BG015_002679 [Linnemannia schmuckeri]